MSTPTFSVFSAMAALVALLTVAACDDDPMVPVVPPLEPNILVPDTIGQQQALRVVFPRAVDSRTALDPANFVVTNLCSGLRVSGALRLSGDTLIFSPTTRLPFLTPLAIRIQNILDPAGRGLTQPVTFRTITEPPPVQDATWEFLSSPTGDDLLTTSFLTRDVGFVASTSGKVFRTTNGGAFFGALFKDEDIAPARVRALTEDTLYLAGAGSFGGSTVTTGGLFRSIDAGLTFQPIFTRSPAVFRSLTVRRAGGTVVAFVVGDVQNFATFRFDEATDSVYQFGPIASQIGVAGQLSRDGSHGVAVGIAFSPTRGVAYRSTDGGRSMQPVVFPAPFSQVPLLTGAGFIDNRFALLVGDSSTVLRLDASDGTVTKLGAAQGIPQTEIQNDAQGTAVTVYQFTDVEFAPNSPVGWVVGVAIVRRPGRPDFQRGVILMTRDGGQTFVRQAIARAPNNGIDFAGVFDIEAISPDFVTMAGSKGVVAARKANAPAALTACTFNEDS